MRILSPVLIESSITMNVGSRRRRAPSIYELVTVGFAFKRTRAGTHGEGGPSTTSNHHHHHQREISSKLAKFNEHNHFLCATSFW